MSEQPEDAFAAPIHSSPESGVDYNLLRSWLGLSPGPWPPDYYSLLDLPPGPHDSATVEARVLERMNRLRRHQLLHPELATEGMNRLAQALITLTDTTEKNAYDAKLGVPPQVAPVPEQPPVASQSSEMVGTSHVVIAEPLLEDDVFSDDATSAEPIDAPDMTQIVEVQWPATPGAPPVPTGAQVIEWERPPPLPQIKPYEIVSENERHQAPNVEVIAPASTSRRRHDHHSRRWLYSRLAVFRKAMRAWERLRPVLSDPQDPVDRPGRVLLLLEAVWEVRPLLPDLRGVVGGVGEPGGLVGSIIKQSLLMDTFRRLLPDQRVAVAIDWRRGQITLQAEYDRLRELTRSSRVQHRNSSYISVAFRWVTHTPELVLIVLAALAVAIALIRTVAQ